MYNERICLLPSTCNPPGHPHATHLATHLVTHMPTPTWPYTCHPPGHPHATWPTTYHLANHLANHLTIHLPPSKPPARNLWCTRLQVMHFLNELYTIFDDLVDHHDLYKLDTVGDCYIVVAGLTMQDDDGFTCTVQGDNDQRLHHAQAMMDFAKAILRESKQVRRVAGRTQEAQPSRSSPRREVKRKVRQGRNIS